VSNHTGKLYEEIITEIEKKQSDLRNNLIMHKAEMYGYHTRLEKRLEQLSWAILIVLVTSTLVSIAFSRYKF